MINYKKYIETTIKEQYPNIGEIPVVKPPNDNMGDFSVACFTLDVDGIKKPNDKANFLSKNLKMNEDYISKIAVVGPYLNFLVNRENLAESTIKFILSEKEKYGSNNQGNGEKLLIEHTSINPNASPHIGRARNSIIGDFLVRLYSFVGYDVDTHYFINDIGKQISMLIVGIEELGDINNISFSYMLDLYVKINEESKKNLEIEKKVFSYLNELENGSEEIRNKFKKVTDICVEGQQKIFTKMGIEFDVFTHESDFVFGDKTNEILNSLKKHNKLCEDENGRLYVDLSNYDIPTKSPVLILTREDKTSLYPLRDIAYTIYKMKLNPKNNFIVLGEDQEVYMKQINAVLDILGYSSPILISYSFVLLNGDKMATREGKVVLLEDFIEEAKNKLVQSFNERSANTDDETISKLAASCIKYNMLNVNRKRNVNFNLEEATNFQGDTAIYLLYNYVRINSILDKLENLTEPKFFSFKNELEHSLISDLYDFPEIVQSTLDSKESIIIVKYLYGIAQKFSKYYKMIPILAENDELIRNSRLALLKSTQIVLENGMRILGIKPIHQM